MAKLDGTNGLIQQYDYQVLTTAFSYTFAAGTQTLIINPAGTLATGTVTMPAAPADGMVIWITTTQQIVALTMNGNTGQTLTSGVTSLAPNQSVAYLYRASNTTWYPFETQMAQGNGSAFNVNRSGTVNPASSTWTKIQLNVESFDTNNNFDSTTNYRFTPTIAGYYQFNIRGIVTGSPSEAYVALYKNGSNTGTYSLINSSGLNQWTGTTSDIWNANGSTDYFELYVFITAGSPACSSLSMSGFMARSA